MVGHDGGPASGEDRHRSAEKGPRRGLACGGDRHRSADRRTRRSPATGPARRGAPRLLRAGLAVLALTSLAAAGCSGTRAAGPAAAPPAVSPLFHGADPLSNASTDLKPGPADAVLTQRGDLTRLGWDSTETSLTVAELQSGDFGRRVAYPVDGKIYAQPLYAPDLTVNGSPHNVVIAVTQHDTVYAFDANATSPSTPPLWKISLLQPGARTFEAATDKVVTDAQCKSIVPEVGISSTPVIDWSTKTLYVVALDLEDGNMTYRMHAIDLLTGKEKQPSTVVEGSSPGRGIDSAGGMVTFMPVEEQQRMGLALVNGTVYAGFSSWCGLSPYHGWVMGFSASSLKQTIVYDDSPNAWGGGLWESGAGITADSHGHIYIVTGNGPFDLNTGGPDAGDSILEMEPVEGTLVAVDEFTPYDQGCRAQHDQDLGSGSPLMVPGSGELILSSKTGSVYVLDQSKLGGYTNYPMPASCANWPAKTDVDKIKQEMTVQTVVGGMWGTWAYWSNGTNAYVYGSGSGGNLAQWKLAANGTIIPGPVAQTPLVYDYPGAIPVVSSDGGNPASAILWTVDQTHGATLRAYEAADISKQIWTSAQDPSRDGLDPGEFDHFSVPATADGLVIVGDQGQLDIYGQLAS